MELRKMISDQPQRKEETERSDGFADKKDILNAFKPCVNKKCGNYDPLDPDENNCGILFAVSSEGCRDYSFCSTF